VEKKAGRRVVVYRKGLFRGVESVARSPEGRAVARAAIKSYMGRGWVAVAARQAPELEARPDLIAIPVDRSTFRPVYSKAVAVEVESCVEVSSHPDQVARNLLKESVRDFAEVHVWVPGKCAGRVREILAAAKPEKPVKVVAVKLEKPKPKAREEPEAREGTTKPKFDARLQALAEAVEVDFEGRTLRVDRECWEFMKEATAKGATVKYKDGVLVQYDNKGYPKMKCRAEEVPAQGDLHPAPPGGLAQD
jgi:hypothetical protein